MMKKFLTLLTLGSLLYFGVAFAAPTIIYQRTILPEVDSTYELGTSTQAWLRANVDELCLTGDSCKTAWPSGVGSATSTEPLMASWFVATSTTATSTFAGGLNVESGGLLYDFSTNNVGIGTTSPYAPLSVVGETVASHFTATSTTATSTFYGGVEITTSNNYSNFTVKQISSDPTRTRTDNMLIGEGAFNLSPGCTVAECASTGSKGGNVIIGARAGINSTAGYADLNTIIGATSSTTAPRYVTSIGWGAAITQAPSITIGANNKNNASYGIMFSSLGGTLNVTCQYGILIGASGSCSHQGSFATGWGMATERAWEMLYGGRAVASTTPSFRLMGSTALFTGRSIFSLTTAWTPDTVSDGTRKSIAMLNVYDYTSTTGTKEFFRGEATGGNQTLALFLNSKVAIGTTTPYAVLSVHATSTEDVIANFVDTASTTVMSILKNGQLNVGTTTASTVQLGLGTVGSTNGTTTIQMGKIQWDGYDSSGARVCAFFVGTTLTAQSGACTP